MGILVAPRPRGDGGLGPGDLAAPPRVFLVDRQPLFLEVLRSVLGGPPLSALIEIGTRSDAAVAAALDGGADLVLCDIGAKPLTGAEVVARLAGASPPVPVILLGDFDELVPALGLLLDDAAGLFNKDVAPDELIAGVQAALDGHQAVGGRLVKALLDPEAPNRGVAGAAARLSPAELEILNLVAQAQPISSIAAAREISPKTVRNHLASIYRKLELKNRAEAMLFAARMGIGAEGSGP